MTRNADGSPVPRHLIFVLKDGSYVIQWDNDQVQDLLTGEARPFRNVDYGQAVQDSDLKYLSDAGIVAHYDLAYVWLYAIPDEARLRPQTQEETRWRLKYFYLNTVLPEYTLDQIQQRIRELGLHNKYAAGQRQGLVAIMQNDGHPFARLADAEAAQHILRRAAPELLADAAVAFIEYDTRSAPAGDDFDSIDLLDLDTLIATQTESRPHEGKIVVGADRDTDFLKEIGETLTTLGCELVPVTIGSEALMAIEDLEPDLVFLDLVMPDTHAWPIVAKMRANQALSSIPVIIITGLGTPADHVFALTVAKVHDYLEKPVALTRLRHSIWTALKGY